MEKVPRSYSVDILRILACLAVILIHIVGVPVMREKVHPGEFDYYVCLFLNAATHWAVPVFVMITGFFMLDPQKNVSIKKLYSKNILRILVALIGWSIVYAAILHKPFYPLGSQEGHFWYLGMIIGVYVSIPILRLITFRPKMMRYFLIAWFCMMTYTFLGNYMTLPFNLDVALFAQFPGYCVLGYYMKYVSSLESSKARNMRHALYWMGIIGFLITSMGDILSHSIDSSLIGANSPNMIFFCASLLLFAASHPLKPSYRRSRFIFSCSECTFGIYLAHVLILIEVYNRLARYVPQMLPHFILCMLIAFFVGYAITFVLKKIPIVGRYFV